MFQENLLSYFDDERVAERGCMIVSATEIVILSAPSRMLLLPRRIVMFV